MKNRASLVLLLLVFLAEFVLCRDHDMVIHEKRASEPKLWRRTSPLGSSLVIPLKFALTQSNLEEAEDLLLSVSHPSSSNFSRHWTPTQVAQKFSPSSETLFSVAAWIRDSGIAAERVFRSHDGGWIHVNTTVQEAEKLLSTKYYVYENLRTGESRVACDAYSVSSSVQQHVNFVTPTIQFGLQLQQSQGGRFSATHLRDTRSSPASLATFSKRAISNCAEQITPECVRALYNIPKSNNSNSENSLGVVTFGWGSYYQNDLDAFFLRYATEMVGSTPIFESIDGGFLQSFLEQFAFNGEVSLDLEYTMALVYPQNVTLYDVGDLWAQGDMNNLLAALDQTYCGALDSKYDPVYPDPIVSPIPGWPGGYNGSDCGNFAPTKVISVSFAWSEAAYSPAYLQRQCLEYLKLGLQGITVIFTSGDYGVAGLDGVCLPPDTGNVTDDTLGLFNPSFPSTCPWVTSVGGTQLPVNRSVTDREIAVYHRFANTTAAQAVTSGGGFSNIFSMPDYQSRHIGKYLLQQQDHLINISSLFNSSGYSRAYPDVATNAANYIIAVDKLLYLVYGTSCSGPVLASIITKINDARLNAGKNSAGFLNPVIYENEWAFNDVVDGFNYGCGGEAFVAAEGWDPITGLGTPDFGRLLELYMALP